MYNWLINSSADPSKLALTVRGLRVFIPAAVIMFAFLGRPDLNEATLLQLLDLAIIIVSGLATAYGAVRKIALTIKPQ